MAPKIAVSGLPVELINAGKIRALKTAIGIKLKKDFKSQKLPIKLLFFYLGFVLQSLLLLLLTIKLNIKGVFGILMLIIFILNIIFFIKNIELFNLEVKLTKKDKKSYQQYIKKTNKRQINEVN